MTSINPLIKYQHNLELFIQDAGYGNHYYGVDREVNPTAIAEIEAYIKGIYPEVTRFCNFKLSSDGVPVVRMLSDYNHGSDNPSFIGVSYMPVRDLVLSGKPVEPCSQCTDMEGVSIFPFLGAPPENKPYPPSFTLDPNDPSVGVYAYCEACGSFH